MNKTTAADDAMQGLWELGDLKRCTLLIEAREGNRWQAVLSVPTPIYPYGWSTYVSSSPNNTAEEAILEVLEMAKVGKAR